jgi:hypothetical protein
MAGRLDALRDETVVVTDHPMTTAIPCLSSPMPCGTHYETCREAWHGEASIFPPRSLTVHWFSAVQVPGERVWHRAG